MGMLEHGSNFSFSLGGEEQVSSHGGQQDSVAIYIEWSHLHLRRIYGLDKMSDTDDLNWVNQNWVLGHLLTLVNRVVGESSSLFWRKLWAGEPAQLVRKGLNLCDAWVWAERLTQEWSTSKWKREKRTEPLPMKCVHFRKKVYSRMELF